MGRELIEPVVGDFFSLAAEKNLDYPVTTKAGHESFLRAKRHPSDTAQRLTHYHQLVFRRWTEFLRTVSRALIAGAAIVEFGIPEISEDHFLATFAAIGIGHHGL